MGDFFTRKVKLIYTVNNQKLLNYMGPLKIPKSTLNYGKTQVRSLTSRTVEYHEFDVVMVGKMLCPYEINYEHNRMKMHFHHLDPTTSMSIPCLTLTF